MDDFEGRPQFKLPLSERLALNAVQGLSPQRAICLSTGRAQCAAELAEQTPEAQVTAFFIDHFPATEVRDYVADDLPNLQVACQPDLPDEEIDLFVAPQARGGETELARDLLQQGYDRLAIGGTLVATIDNAKDTWLHQEIEKLGKNLSRHPKKKGVLYRLKKQKPLKKLKNFECEFAFRDDENLIKVISRPSVFSHRRLDLGARALMEVMEIPEGAKVLDIGCGAGAVGLAAAMRSPDVSVHGIDSNARAVQCLMLGAELNGLSNVSAHLTSSGELLEPGTFDVALGNPPYYSHFTIAEIFLQTALEGLKPGGRVYIVAKETEWLIARMEQLFEEIETHEQRGYTVVTGVKEQGGTA